MRILDLYIYSLKNYAKFNGRACRIEVISFSLAIVLLDIIGALSGLILPSVSTNPIFKKLYLICLAIVGVLHIIPWFAVNVRRLHDLNKSGLWLILLAIPYVNIILLIALLFIPGSKERNNYGPVSENYLIYDKKKNTYIKPFVLIIFLLLTLMITIFLFIKKVEDFGFSEVLYNTINYGCDIKGNNCNRTDIHKVIYNQHNNQIAEYYKCDKNGDNCSKSKKFIYDKNNNVTAVYYDCDKNGNKCSKSTKYTYDKNNNQTAEYFDCDKNGNNCSKSMKYSYDEHNNQTVWYMGCDGTGNNCSSYKKYIYDKNNKKTSAYDCYGDENNCSFFNKYSYNKNNNETIKYSYTCDGDGNNCSLSTKSIYDMNNNPTALYWGCDNNGNNCSNSSKYTYDKYNNITATYMDCDKDGNNCKKTVYINSYPDKNE